MNGSGFQFGSIRGTTIRVETSFLILIAFFVLFSMQSGTPIEHALLWIPVVFLSVLLHELGHASILGLLRFGPSEIALAGMGGFTQNRRRSKPWQEVLVSLAGPITSFLLAALAWWVLSAFPLATRDPMLRAFMPLMVRANISWGILNLLSVHPLDGGQALRNFARIVVSERTALLFSVWLSMLIGVPLVLWSLYQGQLFLAVIAGFLTVQNYQEWKIVRSSFPHDSVPPGPSPPAP